jgi:hypothetical protein
VKTGGSVTLTATVENAVNPMYSWKIEGKVVSTTTSYTFIAEKLGEYFVNFRVDADNGSDEKQVKISVLTVVPPKINMSSTEIVFVGKEKVFVAQVDNAEGATYTWRMSGETVSTTDTYTFNRTATTGNHVLALKVVTADGQDLKEITVTVLPEPQPELYFDDGRYRTVTNAGELRKMSVPIGKELVLAPVVCNLRDTVGFLWKVDGATQTATGLYFYFTPAAQGTYLVSVTEQGSGKTAEVQVTCAPPEGTYRRATGGTKAVADTRFDYIPAPGQFIDYPPGTTKEQATGGMIGAYGGYDIWGFDHSVANKTGSSDLFVDGNAFNAWCESGIVWVMQDNNGNGLPDDTWYELAGSEAKNPGTRYRYAITYYKPGAPRTNTLWTDNIGGTGSVDINGFHNQPYFFPMFIEEDAYTLTGTRLPLQTGMNGTLEVSPCFDWGYADAISSNPARPNKEFWIEDAIRADGTPVLLQYIDFVKVHTAIVGKGAQVGEYSTEAGIPTDLNFNEQ